MEARAKIRKTMQLELKRIQREVGITFLYVTHDQDEAMALGDRIAVMHGGKYEDLGAPARLRRTGDAVRGGILGACNLLAVSWITDAAVPDGSSVGARPGSMASSWIRLPVVYVREDVLRREGASEVPGPATTR